MKQPLFGSFKIQEDMFVNPAHIKSTPTIELAVSNYLKIKNMKHLTAKATAHADINGKILHYLQISNGVSTVNVNVGISTFNKVNELLTEQELPLPENKPANDQQTTTDTTTHQNQSRSNKSPK